MGKLKGVDRPLAYRALLSLLADPDPAMQLAAVASLHALIDDWSGHWQYLHNRMHAQVHPTLLHAPIFMHGNAVACVAITCSPYLPLDVRHDDGAAAMYKVMLMLMSHAGLDMHSFAAGVHLPAVVSCFHLFCKTALLLQSHTQH